MLQLEKLHGLLKKKKQIGRGGSRGGTSGKGTKGQKARSGGGVRPGYEGGQMPLIRRLPKRGFNNSNFKSTYEVVSLSRIAQLFDNGATITVEELVGKGLVAAKRSEGGAQHARIKILGNDPISKKLMISAHAFSKGAAQRIKESGGEARLIEEI